MIKRCKKCGSKDIELFDYGYGTYNPYGGKCKKCDYVVTEICGPWVVTDVEKEAAWNRGQKLNSEEKLKAERSKTRKLRKQLRDCGQKPLI